MLGEIRFTNCTISRTSCQRDSIKNRKGSQRIYTYDHRDYFSLKKHAGLELVFLLLSGDAN